ncbi:MAG: hypothetical protein ABI867_19445 [Kofleriaceae bacterium]
MKLLVLVMLAGCAGPIEGITRTTGAVAIDGDRVRGGEVAVAGGFAGVQVAFDVSGQQLSREEPEAGPGFVRRNKGFGIDLGLRASLFGVLNPRGDHRIERWFDLGAAVSGGGGFVKPARLETFSQGWVGGWVEFGLFPSQPRHRYPVLVLEVRRAEITDWDNATVFVIGLGLARRSPDFKLPTD